MPTASPKREHVWLLYSSSSTSASAGPWPIACFITDQHPPPRPQPRLRSPTTRQMLPFKTSLIRLLLEKISERNPQMGQARILLIDVAMHDPRGKSFSPECLLQPFRHHHRPVFSSGAAECNRQVTLPFLHVVRYQEGQQALDPSQKLPGLSKGLDVPPYLRIFPRKPPQFRHKMRIGQKPHIKHQVGIGRHAELVAETYQRHEQRRGALALEPGVDEMPQFVHIELRGIDHHVGELADWLEQRALVIQALADRKILAQGVGPPRFAVPPQQRVFVRLDEYQDDRVFAPQVLQQTW